jgi:hypothetical protein
MPNAEVDLPALIVGFGFLYYVGKYVWLYRLSGLWNDCDRVRDILGSEKIVRFAAVFLMTVATAVLVSAFLQFVDDSRVTYTMLIFLVSGPAIDMVLDVFPSRGTLCYVVIMGMFISTCKVHNRPEYMWSAVMILGVALVGVAVAIGKMALSWLRAAVPRQL